MGSKRDNSTSKLESVNERRKSLDEWNDRLDDNLEPEDYNNPAADDNAKKFSEKFEAEDESESAVKVKPD